MAVELPFPVLAPGRSRAERAAHRWNGARSLAACSSLTNCDELRTSKSKFQHACETSTVL